MEVMSRDDWDVLCAQVTEEMTSHVKRFAVPLTMSEEHGSGVAWGSGTYISLGRDTWILTAEHVLSNVPEGGRLAHLPKDGGDYNAAFGRPEVAGWPVDAAALPIYPDPQFLPEAARVTSSIAESYSPVDEELLFFYGFPGYTVERNDPRQKDKLIVSRFNHLTVSGKPMLSQAIGPEVSLAASNFDPNAHVAVHYPFAAQRAKDGVVVPVPNAAGMSGSALWDTKFVDCVNKGISWTPEYAEICGVVWAVLDNPEVIFATKIENVRAGLPEVF
ncbi:MULTISPECIES: hypothetical protein [Stenotrophomonas]|uniref:hypothetical protein n=1 Tax=Stenotrophomonas TaxID=40323 RepID=UPI00191F591C|nr:MULTISPECIES: hypothetical protein [Stenotrophomonas]MBL0733499.1 hypothetical protein [Stenotrophomonas maltophilia]MBL0755442.1 hypothetical protein [Stenotrophomonas maltophilia]